MAGFARHIADRIDAHLVLAGPAADSVTDDPEGAAVVGLVRDVAPAPARDSGPRPRGVAANDRHRGERGDRQRASAASRRRRAEEPRRGFGLTVAEAMWKERAVVASAVGGIQDQIVDGESGVLLQTRATSQRSVAQSFTCWGIANKHAGSASRHARVSGMSSWDPRPGPPLELIERVISERERARAMAVWTGSPPPSTSRRPSMDTPSIRLPRHRGPPAQRERSHRCPAPHPRPSAR